MIVTFDFDNTIAMSQMMITDNGDVEFEFQGYNEQIVGKIKQHIQNGDEVHIVTSRTKAKEGLYPEDTIEKHLKKLNLHGYFLPYNLHFTDGEPKINKLRQLGSEMHWDDDVEEMLSLKNSGMNYQSPLELLPDSDMVAKVVIFDKNDKVLVLQRGDEKNLWDLPGGHLKQIEELRGEDGILEGGEREVAEETGIILPFQKKIGNILLPWEGKDYNIHIILSKLEEQEPEVNLNLQDFQENIAFEWLTLKELQDFLPHSTKVLKSAVEMLPKGNVFEQNEPFQRLMKQKHRKMKKKLIGKGNNRHFGGGRGHQMPSYSRSKSAPPMGEAHEDEKRTIKVKIITNIDEKRKKKAKKKKKSKKFAYYGGYFPDSDGDGGGGE